jgi:VCBS repeat protein
MTRSAIASIVIVIVVLLALVWLSRDRLWPGMFGGPRQQTSSRAASPGGTTASMFASRAIGDPPRGEERPQIAHVAIADLDRDGLNDVLVCDAFRNIVTWIRQAPRGAFTETTIAGVAAPAHVEAIDFDGDGDLDVSVAGFGYDDGETSWLENQDSWKFQQHILQQLSGPINAIPIDINGDKFLDIVALVSQEWGDLGVYQRRQREAHATNAVGFDQPGLRVELDDARGHGPRMHPIASSPTHLLTLAVGDLDGDRKPDAVPAGCISAARMTASAESPGGSLNAETFRPRALEECRRLAADRSLVVTTAGLFQQRIA